MTFISPLTARDPQAVDTARATDMIGQVHNLFEAWIRENPEDWFCTKRLWEKPKAAKIDKPEETGRDADIDSYAA